MVQVIPGSMMHLCFGAGHFTFLIPSKDTVALTNISCQISSQILSLPCIVWHRKQGMPSGKLMLCWMRKSMNSSLDAAAADMVVTMEKWYVTLSFICFANKWPVSLCAFSLCLWCKSCFLQLKLPKKDTHGTMHGVSFHAIIKHCFGQRYCLFYN